MERTADSVVVETTPRPTSTNHNNNKAMGFLSYGHYPTVSYKECMRNHAASMGGHALDGCCEFMASPATYKADDPSSLRCAACGCHRNFHRRDPDDPAPLHRHRPTQMPMTPLGFPGGGRKRFRTRFSEEQKEKMRGFAERFGWKMQKIDKGVVEEFCKEVGVAREVLKVWMHNHKAADQGAAAGAGAGGGPHNNHHTHNNHHHNGGVAAGGQFDHDVVVSSGDGSSSSSSSGFSIG